MTRVLLVRHGRTTANAAGVLAGRMPDVHLDSAGVRQAKDVGAMLRMVPVTQIVSSPLPRTLETAKLIRSSLEQAPKPRVGRDADFLECDYGIWTGKKLKKLGKDPLWAAVQGHPSSVTFPGGESMLAAQARAVTGIHRVVRRANEENGGQSVVLIVSHGDIIKSIVADAFGMHLDMFQRIVIDPGSVTAIDYTSMRPFVRLVNATSNIPDDLRVGISHSSEAAVGGGRGRT